MGSNVTFDLKGPGIFRTEGLAENAGQWAASAFWSLPEYVGFEAPAETRAWRSQNPLAGLTSQLASAAVPIGWLLGTSKIPRYGKALTALTKGFKNPIMQVGARELLRMAPLEASRLVIGPTLGGMSMEDAAIDTMTNLGAEFIFGSGLAAIGKLGKPASELADLIPSFPYNEPSQLQLQHLRAQKATIGETLTTEQLSAMNRVEGTLFRHIRTEMAGLPKGDIDRLTAEAGDLGTFIKDTEARRRGSYVKPLEPWNADMGKDAAETQRNLTKYFIKDSQASGARDFSSMHALAGKGGVANEATLASWLEKAQVPADADNYTGFMTFVQAEKGGPTFDSVLKGMETLGDGWSYVKEADGLYVLAKKIDDATNKVGERWMQLKTSSPQKYAPRNERFVQDIVDTNAWAKPHGEDIDAVAKLLAEEKLTPELAEQMKLRFTQSQTPSWDVLDEFTNREFLNFIDEAVAAAPKSREGLLDTIAKAMDVDLGGNKTVREGLSKFVDEYLAPREHQLLDNRAGRRALMATRVADDLRTNLTNQVLHGEFSLPQGKNAIGAMLSGRIEQTGGLVNLAKKMTPEDWVTWNEVEELGIRYEQLEEALKSGQLTPRAYDLRKADYEGDAFYNVQETAAAAKVGDTSFEPKVNRGIGGRAWEGEHRVPVLNKDGHKVYIAGKKRLGDAKKDAEEAMVRLNAEEAGHVMGNPFKSDSQNVLLARQMGLDEADFLEGLAPDRARRVLEAVREASPEPLTFKPRLEIGGYKTDWDTKSYIAHVSDMSRVRSSHIVDMGLRDTNSDLLQTIANLEDTHALSIITKRMRDFSGIPNKATTSQNQAVDKLSGGLLGRNAASKIAKHGNAWQIHTTIGGGNLGFSTISLMQVMQTSLPEISSLMHAPLSKLAPFYTHHVLANAARKPIKTMSTMDPLKIFMKAIKTSAKPDEMMQNIATRALNDGTLSMTEEIVDHGILALGDLKMKEGDNLMDWMKRFSTFGITSPERTSRLISLAAGKLAATDILGLTNADDIYKVAQEFVNKTMYRYGVADKSSIFTGPAGSMFGLFKNWSLNYMFSMFRYANGDNFAKQVLPTLAWLAGGTAAVGGLSALPFWNVADEAAKAFTDKSLMNHVYDGLTLENPDGTPNTMISDAVYFGAPAMLGYSVSSSAKAPMNDLARDTTSLFTSIYWNRMVALGRAAEAAGVSYKATGDWNPLRSQRFRELSLRAVAPKTAYRFATSMLGDDIRSANTGYPIVTDSPFQDRLMYTLGFNPTEVAQTWALNQELRADQQAMSDTITAMGNAWLEAERRGDSDTMYDIMRVATLSGIDMDRLMRSVKAKQSIQEEGLLESKFDEESLAAFAGYVR